MLPDKFTEPKGFQWGTFTNPAGFKIRYGSIQPDGAPKGTMVLAPGFREPIEKYFETIRDMTARGFAVWILDWQGQGASDRLLKNAPMKMHSTGYGAQIDTLHQFATKVVAKSAGPMILMGHSMGGHIGLRYLNEHAGVFDSAVLTAPMLDVVTPVWKFLARKLVYFAKLGGNLEKYAPGGGDWKPEPFEGNRKSSDPVRFNVMNEILATKPSLQMGDETYGWVYHTFQSIDVIQDEAYLRAIKTPVLMEISGNDNIVKVSGEQRAASLLPNCTKVEFPASKHEIWMERDALRNQWLKTLDTFLETRLNPPAPTPKKPGPNKLKP